MVAHILFSKLEMSQKTLSSVFPECVTPKGFANSFQINEYLNVYRNKFQISKPLSCGIEENSNVRRSPLTVTDLPQREHKLDETSGGWDSFNTKPINHCQERFLITGIRIPGLIQTCRISIICANTTNMSRRRSTPYCFEITSMPGYRNI